MDRRVNCFLNQLHLEQYSDKFIHFDYVTFLTLRRNEISKIISSASDSTKLYKAIKSFLNEPDSEDETVACIITSEIVPCPKIYETNITSSTNDFVLPVSVPFEKRIFQSPLLTITNIESLPANFKINKEIGADTQLFEMIGENQINVNNVRKSAKCVDFIPSAKRKLDDSFQSRPVTIKKIVSTIRNEVGENVKINEKAQAPSETENGNNNVRKRARRKRLPIKQRARITQQNNVLKKIVTTLDFKQVQDLDMHILVSTYKHKSSFTDSERILLSEVLIKQILMIDSTFVLKKSDFLNLANLIINQFRFETIKFYVKKTYNLNKEPNRGSLYTAYDKYKEYLNSTGLVTSAKKKDVFPPRKSNFNRLKNKFIRTRGERFKTKRKGPKKCSIITYMKTHEVLRDKLGYTLIINDAEYLYPKLKGIMASFHQKAELIIAYAQKLQIDDEYVTNLLSYATEDMLVKQINFLAILLLPYVMPQATLKRDENNPFIISHLASSVRFVRLFKGKVDEIRIYKQLVREDPKFKTGNVNLKIYGKFDKVNKCVVEISTTQYTFKDPIRAIEVFFKMFLGLNEDYPCYARHIFYCFEKIAFDIQTIKRNKADVKLIDPFLRRLNRKNKL